MSVTIDQIKQKLAQREAGVLDARSSKSAVFVPFIEKDKELHILFQVRSKQLTHQPGEVCFPGGRVDLTDTSEEATAKRELCEELGLSEADITSIAPLDVLVTPFRGTIFPYVGQILSPNNISPSEHEVEEIFTVPLSFLLQTEPELYKMNIHFEPDENFPFDLIPNREAYTTKRTQTIPELFYFYDQYVIWGLTARILHHLIELIKSEH
ncbi:NUDIX hydrolase [Alkalihalobacterium alkalinitrilicum]|uniref:NUDIX hydrolase n=1 Tax=Alkalihalobacterium alkalinitrilicum TaxID=427920 RepID=UPI001EE482CB|nr:CoA pyrophosphatase [Alkalihalobacterium alkalinitrilicum]